MSTAGELFDIVQGFLAVAVLGIFAFLGLAAFSFFRALLRRPRRARPAPKAAKAVAPLDDPIDDEEWSRDFG